MRRRLIASIAGVAMAGLLGYGVPRAFMIASQVRDQQRSQLSRSADLLAAALGERAASDRAIDEDSLSTLLRRDEAAAIQLPGGRMVVAGQVSASGSLRATRPLAGGGRLELRLSGSSVDQHVTDALFPLVAVGGLALLGAILLALVLARRLAAPFVALVEHADQIGVEGDRRAPRSGIPEADHLADALDRSRLRIAELLRQEREFSSNASHQLRTPIAALRLRVEDVSRWPETPELVVKELTAALREIDRLGDVVTDLLELARSGGLGGTSVIVLDQFVHDAIERWRPQFDSIGRRLLATPITKEVVVASSGRAIDLVLDVLFENALRHGAGTVDVSIQVLDHHVALCVADEGTIDRSIVATAFERSVRSSTSTGSGIGLALARTIAESAGARLQIVSRAPTVFELDLPVPSEVLPDR